MINGFNDIRANKATLYFRFYDCVNQSVKRIAETLYLNFSSRVQQYFENISCVTATYLDPRYKKFKFIADCDT